MNGEDFEKINNNYLQLSFLSHPAYIIQSTFYKLKFTRGRHVLKGEKQTI
jgi:hypothetical protein